MTNEYYGWLTYVPNYIQYLNATTQMNDQTQVNDQYGISQDYLILLANQFQKDLWICSPKQAEANWDQQYALNFYK